MKNLLIKELKLSTAPITYCFLAFGLMTMLPGYPILLGAFFLCLGIFQSFRLGRENHDILYTVLLPIRKSDAVRAKFLSVCAIELAGFLLMTVLTFVRMMLLQDAAPYVANPLMNANPLFLGFALALFGTFNAVFVRGFFKTAYAYTAPFVCFLLVSALLIAAAEALHFFPGLEWLNATALGDAAALWPAAAAGALLYAGMTAAAYRSAVRKFEEVDL